jgi:hypothetical protein
MKTIDITDLAETTIATLKALIENREEEALTTLSAELGDRLSYTADTEEDWDTDEDGDPTCRTTTTVKLACDGEEIASGEATGYYTHCKSGGEQWSSWQDGDGADHDDAWNLIAEMLVAAEVIGATYDLDESIEAPAEPAEPKEDDNGEYVVLYHGWEQSWTIKSRHATKEDAERACRNAERATKEANSSGAYGWEYAVAVIDEDGTEEIDGLKLTICESEEA